MPDAATRTPDIAAAVAAEIARLRILDFLGRYQPVAIGSLPLGIGIEGSDLDMALYAPDLGRAARDILAAYGGRRGFTLARKKDFDAPALVARFETRAWPVELFCQPIPVAAQYGWRHFAVEARALHAGGAALAKAVRRLKRGGHNTEAAFCELLGIAGDPFRSLLTLEGLSEEDLFTLCSARL